MLKVISLGADPESFLEDETGKVISAIGKIGGTKEKPKPIKTLGKGFAVQEDNVLLEYNIPPAKNISNWVEYNMTIREYLKEMLAKKKLLLSTKASHSMDPDQMDHPNAFVMGCDPDFDAWAKRWNKKPHSPDPMLRSGGAHIHVAYHDPNPADSIRMARCMDYWVGAPLMKLDPDKRRPLFYGRPGAIRFKPYGFEYRTPSNFWCLSQQTIEAVFYNTCEAVIRSQAYDNYDKYIQSARKFLAMEADDFDESYFLSTGCSYTALEPGGGQKVSKKPSKTPKLKDLVVDFDDPPPQWGDFYSTAFAAKPEGTT